MVRIEPQRLIDAYQTARSALLDERNGQGYWTGELSTSALATATAVCALSLVRAANPTESRLEPLVRGGLEWLADHQNPDGGWGDTTKSLSNISTTMLARAAIEMTGRTDKFASVVTSAEQYIENVGSVDAVRARYGKDRTFAVPILMTCALAGQVPWSEVGTLPFELAALPPTTFKWLKLPVVSYALPALIAVGQVKFANDPPGNPLVRGLRRAAVGRSLRVLESIQPTSGGFLEAVPLTSFVTMALAGMGHARHRVAQRGVEFLVDSARSDGSWPIDSNLSVWLTTLSVNALHNSALQDTSQTRDWLLAQQFRGVHPYTNAPPGAWGWTHLPGSVPDADDTAGALLALANMAQPALSTLPSQVNAAAVAGLGWLLDLQNRDGGWPTFCRGWGHLPFDRSGADLTAHALRALAAWQGIQAQQGLAGRIQPAIDRGLAYLRRCQRSNGAWVPLWFGNQHAPGEENPTYGTARVLIAYRDLGMIGCDQAVSAISWLLETQNPDGGWGCPGRSHSSVEESALAMEALADVPESRATRGALQRALQWLVPRIGDGSFTNPSPIGFYFAKLWYYERLYPLIFTVAALGRLVAAGQADGARLPRHADRKGRLLKTELRSG